MKKVLFILLTLTLFSCSDKKSNEIIRVSVGAEPQSIDPSFLSAVDSMIYAVHIFEGLTIKIIMLSEELRKVGKYPKTV